MPVLPCCGLPWCAPQADVDTGKSAHQLSPTPPMNSLQWNPRHYLLAYAGDEDGPRHAPPGAGRGLDCGNVLLMSGSCVGGGAVLVARGNAGGS